eukprot:5396009-Amphidinium_carterae.1
MSKHVLQNTLKGGLSVDVLWDECFAEVVGEKAEPKSSLTGRVKLGVGDPWRFQSGPQFAMSDLQSLVGVGALLGEGSRQSWSSVSTVWPIRKSYASKHVSSEGARVLVCQDASCGEPTIYVGPSRDATPTKRP